MRQKIESRLLFWITRAPEANKWIRWALWWKFSVHRAFPAWQSQSETVVRSSQIAVVIPLDRGIAVAQCVWSSQQILPRLTRTVLPDMHGDCLHQWSAVGDERGMVSCWSMVLFYWHSLWCFKCLSTVPSAWSIRLSRNALSHRAFCVQSVFRHLIRVCNAFDMPNLERMKECSVQSVHLTILRLRCFEIRQLCDRQ
jgi:hypothetical protein